MACTPLSVDNGGFITATPWESTASRSFDGKTVTLTTAGPNPGLAVQKGAQSLFHQQLTNHNLLYAVLGNKHLVILDMETGGGSTQRWVSLVNFDTMVEVPILTVLAPSTIAPPKVDPSQGSGAAFLAYGQNGTDHASVAIYRSDTGAVLCSLGTVSMPTGQTTAEATATEFIIHYSTGGTSRTQKCPRPLGKCTIAPASQTFPDVFIGGCSFTPPTKQFTIKNTGTDCLTVNPVAGAAPFSVQSTSKPLPTTLSPTEQVDVTIAFNPSAVGNWNPVSIPVATMPANGDSALLCRGKALPAEFKVGFSATTLAFGTQPVMSSSVRQLTITNTGSKPMTVSSAGVAADGFSVAAFSNNLGCGQSMYVQAQFLPPTEGPHSASFSVAHSAPSNPTTITLSGQGCVANAEITAPPTAPIGFGQIQQGFRTVRLFKVLNPGDGPLQFQADISGPDAGLFGLPDPAGSVLSPPSSRTYVVDPVTPCGPLPAGSGETVVAVSFFAGEPPKLASATLTLSGHTATNYPPGQTWVYPLSAEITPPVALDIGLVVDRSDSMNQPLGSRVKMDAAVSASQLFIELLRADLDDRVALVRFNNDRNVVVSMTPVSSGIAPTQAQIRNQVASGVPPATGLTAIAGGTMLGVHEVETPHPGAPSPLTRAVVVLTDGIENTAFEEPPGTWLSIRGGQMWKPDLGSKVATAAASWPAEIDRYAVGLGRDGEVDPGQLNVLTGDPGRVFYVNQNLTGTLYFQLEKYFTQVFMDVVGTAPILDPMYWIAAGDTHAIEFEVLPGDVDALVVIYDFEGQRLPFWCESPSGEVIDPAVVPPGYQLRSGHTDRARLVEFKMPPKEPDRYAGTWRVVVEHRGSVCFGPPGESREPGFLPRECEDGVEHPLLYGIAVGVGSNFRMQPLVTPAPVHVGEPILLTALISEAGLPVTGSSVEVEVTTPSGATSILALADDGAHDDGEVDDGEYAASFKHTAAPGIYHFRFRAVGMSHEGKTVVREAVRDKPVIGRQRPGEEVVGRPPTGQPVDGERPESPDAGCCPELLDEIRRQTSMLDEVLRDRERRRSKESK